MSDYAGHSPAWCYCLGEERVDGVFRAKFDIVDRVDRVDRVELVELGLCKIHSNKCWKRSELFIYSTLSWSCCSFRLQRLMYGHFDWCKPFMCPLKKLSCLERTSSHFLETVCKWGLDVQCAVVLGSDGLVSYWVISLSYCRFPLLETALSPQGLALLYGRLLSGCGLFRPAFFAQRNGPTPERTKLQTDVHEATPTREDLQ